jgi:hypothetical protein
MSNPKAKSLHARITELTADLAEARQVIALTENSRRVATGARDAALAERDAARLALARLQGYVDRVHEGDDAASERLETDAASNTIARSVIARIGTDGDLPRAGNGAAAS